MSINKLIKLLVSYKAIVAIFALSLFLRLFQLSAIPHGFHVDEVMSGYIGRFILLNGKDVYGNAFPLLYFNTFGDFRTILPMYINGLSTFIFGVTIFAVRFPTAFIGALAVFPTFFISNMLFKDKKMAFLPPIILAILPWNIILSRATEEAVVGLTLTTFAIYFLLKSIFEKKLAFLFLGCLCLLITYFVYPSFRLLAPLMLLPLPFFASQRKIMYIISACFFVVVTGLFLLTPYGQGRFQQTSLLGNKELANSINAENTALNYNEGNNNILVARVFHNKMIGYLQEFEKQYFSYYSPNFLFFTGALPDRYVVPNTGLLYITFGILLFGILLPTTIILNNTLFSYLLYLLVISPLPAALTLEDSPNLNRDILMSFLLVFLISIGFVKAFHFFKDKRYKIIFSSVIVVAILIEFLYFQHQYFAISPAYKPVLRDDGNQELVMDLQKFSNKQSIIVPIHDMPMYYLFFNNDFAKNLAGKFEIRQTKLFVGQINNITFVTSMCPSEEFKPNQKNMNEIIIDDGNCPPNNSYNIVSTITRKDATVAFRILSIK